MDHDRRYVLAGVVLVVGAFTAYLLRQVLPTVFFAISVAYLLAPVQEWFERRGLSSWWASVGTTAATSAILVGVVSPLLYVLYLRSQPLLDLIDRVPRSVTIRQFGVSTTLTVEQAIPVVRGFVENLLLSAAGAAPVLAIKLTVFAIVVFALLIARKQVHDAVRAVVPLKYHDIVESMGDRARDTLFAIYVLQAATAAATFAISLPIFYLLGYEYPITLATIAGVLQFVPIVGPSVLVGGVAIADVVLQNTTRAIMVAVLGMVFIAYLPDPLVRPRLARRTADLPGSLYFVGFTGGLFTMGVVGVIAGPLLVALLVESVELLAAEMDDHRTPDDADPDGANGSPPDGESGSGEGRDSGEPPATPEEPPDDGTGTPDPDASSGSPPDEGDDDPRSDRQEDPDDQENDPAN